MRQVICLLSPPKNLPPLFQAGEDPHLPIGRPLPDRACVVPRAWYTEDFSAVAGRKYIGALVVFSRAEDGT